MQETRKQRRGYFAIGFQRWLAGVARVSVINVFPNAGIRGVVLAVIAVFPVACLGAVEAVSDVFVGMAVAVPGRTAGTVNYSFISVPTVQPAVAAGAVSIVGSSSFVDAHADWSAGTVGSPFYVEFSSGLMADITGMDTATKTIHVGALLPGIVSAGQTYKIRKHLSVADIFGPQNQAELLGGLNINVADNVILHDGASQVSKTYFYYNRAGYEAWRSGITPSGSDLVRPGQGIIVGRRSSGDTAVYTIGAIKNTPTLKSIYPGWNVVGTIKAGASLSLIESRLFTGNSASGVAAGQNIDQSDFLMVMQSDGSSATYYYNSDRNSWYTGITEANASTISPGSAFYIKRRADKPSFDWLISGE